MFDLHLPLLLDFAGFGGGGSSGSSESESLGHRFVRGVTKNVRRLPRLRARLARKGPTKRVHIITLNARIFFKLLPLWLTDMCLLLKILPNKAQNRKLKIPGY